MDTSQNNLSLIRQAYEAFGRGDIPSVLNAMDENIHFQVAEGGLYGGTYYGHDEVVKGVFNRLFAEWDGFRVTPREYIEGQEIIVTLGQYDGKFKATGKNIQIPFAHVWRFRNGKVSRMQEYTDTALLQSAAEGAMHGKGSMAAPL